MRMKITLSLGLVILAVLNFQIYRKERLIKGSEEIFLELAPVDPRSLLQGDYMALNYKIANEMRDKLQEDEDAPPTGRVVVGLDDKRIATYRGTWAGVSFGTGGSGTGRSGLAWIPSFLRSGRGGITRMRAMGSSFSTSGAG